MQKAELNYKQAMLHLSKGEASQALTLMKSVYVSGSELAPKALVAILQIVSLTDRDSESIELLEDACRRYPQVDIWPAGI